MLTPDLATATGQLYDAFAGVAKPQSIDGCRHCVDDAEVAVLLRKPLWDLAPDDLASYASSAFLTVGAVADYLYFLPRILEVSTTDPAWWPDPEVTGRAIQAAGVLTWPSDRRDALCRFLTAVVDDSIRSADYDRLDSWLCAIGRTGLDIRPFLARVTAVPAAVRGYYDRNADALSRGQLSNAFWEASDPARDVVIEWFLSEISASRRGEPLAGRRRPR